MKATLAFWFAILSAALVSGRAVGADEPLPMQAETLNAMTWNVRYDSPFDGANRWKHRKSWVAETITKQEVDIACLQEVLGRQLDDLKQLLPEMDFYGVGRTDGERGGEFCPIFYRRDRFELLDKATFWLSPTPDEAGSKGWDAAITRIATWVKLKNRQSGQVFYVINTHFDHIGEQSRVQSAALLLERLRGQFADHPALLAGDLNTKPDTPPYNTLVAAEKALPDAAAAEPVLLRDSYAHSAEKPVGPDSTWNAFKAIVPGERIDYVFVTKAWDVLELKTLDEQREGRFASDHLPVVTKLRLVR